jgi:hypothetical protein
MDELDAAVMVPSFLKAGRRVAIVELDLAWAFVNGNDGVAGTAMTVTGVISEWRRRTQWRPPRFRAGGVCERPALRG